jgi:hypothetical protein
VSTATYAITVIAPPRYAHAAALRELAETLFHGLRELGCTAFVEASPVPTPIPGARPIILGAHLLPPFIPLSPAAIIYNTEQIGTRESPFVIPSYFDRLRAARVVWDYSFENVTALRELGIAAQLVPVGYVPQLDRIPSSAQDIDVLFYGSTNERRRDLLTALKTAGINITWRFSAYGEERDKLISRAKIVLNVHYYSTQLFEVVRVSYLLANHKCVVSETPTVLDFASGVAFAPYNGIVAKCQELLADDSQRERIAACGYEIMRRRAESTYLRAALAALH